MRIIDELISFLKDNNQEIKDVDTFYKDDKEGLMLQQGQSSIEQVYMDLSTSGTFNFSIFAKNDSMEDAVKQLFDCEQLLSFPPNFELTDGLIMKTISMKQSAHPISRDAKNNLVYGSDFELKYYMENTDV